MSTIYNELNSLNVIARYKWDPVYQTACISVSVLFKRQEWDSKDQWKTQSLHVNGPFAPVEHLDV